MNDDGNENAIGLAYIDYAFSLSYEWSGVAQAQADPRATFPSGIGFDAAGSAKMLETIEKLEEQRVREIVNRVPAEYHSAIPDAKDVVVSTLLSRRGRLRGWLP